MRKLLMVSTVQSTLRAFLLPFAEHFSKNGYIVHAATSGNDLEPLTRYFSEVFHVSWRRSPLALRANLAAMRSITGILRRGKYDLVHVHTPVASFLTRLALSRMHSEERPRLIYTAHGFHFHSQASLVANGAYVFLEKIAGRFTDYLVVINEEDRQSALRHRLVRENRVRLFPGIGVDVDKLSPNSVSIGDIETVRSELGLQASEHYFLVVAELNPGKRHSDALLALSLAGEQLRNVHLVFAGIGPLERTLKQRARALHIENRVHFLGYRRDIPVLMRGALAVLMPSEREGLNRSVMEALSLEVPVIGSDARGVKDLLRDGAGVIVPVGDVEGYTNAMIWAVDNRDALLSMAKTGRRRMIEAHSLSHVIRLHEELYNKALRDT